MACLRFREINSTFLPSHHALLIPALEVTRLTLPVWVSKGGLFCLLHGAVFCIHCQSKHSVATHTWDPLQVSHPSPPCHSLIWWCPAGQHLWPSRPKQCQGPLQLATTAMFRTSGNVLEGPFFHNLSWQCMDYLHISNSYITVLCMEIIMYFFPSVRIH